DCFTYRLQDRERMFARMNEWNTHLSSIASPETTSVRDPTNIGELENRLDDCTDSLGMVDRGAVVIDSLTEFGSLVQPIQAYDFLKDTRAEICKGRFVPIYAGAAYVGDAEQFPHDLEYMFDGIIDLELNPKIVEDTLIKRVRIRKMDGVLCYPEWTAYEFTSGEGLVMFDPQVELEKAAESDASQGTEDDE
ncbi:MAG: recombinase RecA, partial [Halobacteriales archaeon]|nr:recombinase RecA [Halobacteriales archaeon]